MQDMSGDSVQSPQDSNRLNPKLNLESESEFVWVINLTNIGEVWLNFYRMANYVLWNTEGILIIVISPRFEFGDYLGISGCKLQIVLKEIARLPAEPGTGIKCAGKLTIIVVYDSFTAFVLCRSGEIPAGCFACIGKHVW